MQRSSPPSAGRKWIGRRSTTCLGRRGGALVQRLERIERFALDLVTRERARELRDRLRFERSDGVPRARLPRRLRTVLLRGLAPGPADRHADMDALLAALRRARSPRLLFATIATLVAVALGAGVMSSAKQSDDEPAESLGSDARR